jgi:hypothetical protein
MSDQEAIEGLLDQFFQAVKTNDMGLVPLADQVSYSGNLLPKAAEGAVAVRNYLSGAAPFIKSFQIEERVIASGSAAVLVRYEGINGVQFEGSYFMDFEQGRIARIRTVFDSRPLMQ